ncbi:MAG: U32 family peptidase [Paracoccaceae bacterium]
MPTRCFFRAICGIGGDTAAGLALRNAIDDAELDLAVELGILVKPPGLLMGVAFGRASQRPCASPHGHARSAAMMELVCPAGTLPCAPQSRPERKRSIAGFADETNARNFPGHFDRDEMAAGVAFAHGRAARSGCDQHLPPRRRRSNLAQVAIADAETTGAGVILADAGLLAHAENHPDLRRHICPGKPPPQTRTRSISCAKPSGIRRVVLPRVLTVDEIAAINRETDVETEVFVFGALRDGGEGRCSLSSYATENRRP